MSPGLDCPPILAAGYCYCGNGIHNALVMRSRSERVRLSEVVCLDHSLDHFPTLLGIIAPVRHLLGGENRTNPSKPVDCQIADYPQDHRPTGYCLYLRCNCLSHGIDRICPHSIPAVDQNVDNEHWSRTSLYHPSCDVSAPSSELNQDGVYLIAARNQLIL